MKLQRDAVDPAKLKTHILARESRYSFLANHLQSNDEKRKRDAVASYLVNDGDYAYYLRVSAGTPRQDFLLQFDTGSDVMWIGSHTCGINCNNRHYFKPYLSSTYRSYNSTDTITYGAGSVRGIESSVKN
jgi:cathepsin D